MESDGRATEEDEKKPAISRTSSQQQQYNAKAAKVLEACKWKDVHTLRALATSEGGLLSDDLRRQTWPFLLGYPSQDDDVESETEKRESWKRLPKHRDEDQVQLDVNRSFIYYPHDQSMKDLDRRKEELSDLITEVLRRHPYLCYFQGYHDICQVFLLVLGHSDRSAAVARLSALRIRDFMLPTLAPALAQLRLIPAILYAVDPKLYNHLSQTQPFFALSGTLTMYAHDIQEYGDIARLFDVFLAREAAFSVYMFAQIVIQRSDELFETPADEPEMLHSILSKLPKPLDLEALIQNTAKLFEKYPPEKLRLWRSISNSSVLKTARWEDQTVNQTLEDGEMFFNKQVRELEWADRRDMVIKVVWKYRRPAGTIGLAVLVGVLSFWIRKSSGPSGVLGAFWRQWTGYRGH
ncbi:GTPase-activating protein [Lachnellula occidentalis]|uniref:GTPase-activating protein n=1 Tax=Lachnellula occidentalis TaxID=215460 RepID=A0A8H8UH72_9HELO|nr:GTPase-activating protein [Lachnellula occidentalis]